MIKLVVTDLDETFLRGDKTISPRTREVFLRLREQGIKTVYATARGATARNMIPAELFDGWVNLNGALAYTQGGTLVYSRLIPLETCENWLTAADKAEIRAAAEVGGKHYSNFEVSEVWPAIQNYEICRFSQLSGQAEKLYALVETEEQIRCLENALPPETYQTVSRDGLAQVMHREAVKAKAVSALASYWGIGLEETAAFGDDRNDMDMLRACGCGVAMGNALEEVKRAADCICGTNEEDGLADWIERNILRKEEET